MDLTQKVRDYFKAYEMSDRSAIEGMLAAGFTFTSPFDDAINEDVYFARCWPNNTNHWRFDFDFLAQDGERVMVAYTANLKTGNPVHPEATFRNAECHVFEQGRLKSVEVFFGDPPGGLTREQFSKQSGAG